jgi:hypothetical protein
MTNFSRSLMLIFALLALTFSAGASSIVTVTYTGEEFGSQYGPYYLNITGTAPVTGPGLLGLCLTNLIYIPGGPWQAEEVAITDFSNTGNPTFTKLQELAYLYTAYGFAENQDSANVQAIHQAAWDIALGNTAFNDSLTTSWVTLAQTNHALAGSNYSILIPIDTNGNYNFDQGVSQTFLIKGGGGNPPSSTPEPASMFLFGTGLIGLGLVGRNRHAKK